MATIDNLDIQIAGSAKKANVAINGLIKNLDRLANSLKIDTSGLEKIGKSLNLSGLESVAKNIQAQMSNVSKSTESQMQKISKSATEAAKEFQDKFKNIDVKVDFSNPEAELRKFQKQAQTAENSLSRVMASSSADKRIGEIEKLSITLAQATNGVKLLEKHMGKLKDSQPQLDVKTVDARSISHVKLDSLNDAQFDEWLKTLPTVKAQAEEAAESVKEIAASATEAAREFTGVWEGVKLPDFDTDEQMQTAREKIKSLSELFKDVGKDFDFDGNLEQLEAQFKKFNAELEHLYKKRDKKIDLGEIDTKQFKDIIYEIQSITNKMDILEAHRPEALNRTLQENAEKAKKTSEEMETLRGKLNQLVIPPINETNLEKLQSELKKTEEELERLRAKLANGLIMGDIKESPDDRGFQNFSAEITLAEKKADALRQKIQDIGGAAKAAAALKELPKLFQNLGKTAKKAATIIKSVASKITSAFSKIGNSSKQLKTASLNLGSLLKTAIGFKAIRELGEFGKEAIGLGSNIAEVENIVNAAFGSMAGMAYDFASTATEKFGLSELAAKKYSGTMMAMLKSSGVAQGAAAQMSTTLAGLAGDLASFYNIDADTAFQKLRAGISGETEPLKQLGINMNIVNLEAFAAAQGINKAYREMTLAEQATLRYNYILAKTGDAQGDFARTSGTWANQIRLLKMNFESLSAIIGQGLIAAILPAVQMLNKLMSVLKKAAESFRTFMYTLMGKKVEGSQGGIADSMEGMEDISYGMADVEDATDGTTDSVKELKKALSVLSFDELHQLSAAMEDLGKDTSKTDTGNLDDLGNVLGGAENLWDELAKTDVEGPISEWAKRIREAFLAQDWERLGYEIADGINRGLQKIYDAINWKNVGPKIEKFMDAFTRTFNSLVDNIDWDLLGRTLGAGINTLVNTLNLLIEGIDFKNIGRKLSEGLRGMVGEIEWRSLGNLFGNYFMISWDILNGFVTDMARKNDAGLTGFAELGISIGEAINGVFEKINFSEIYQTVTTGINGIFESIKNLADTINWDEIADNISNGLNTMIRGMDWEGNGQALNEFMSKFLGAVLRVAENTDWEGLGRGIGEFLSQIDWGKHLGTVAKIIVEVLGGLLSGLSETTAGKWVVGLGAALMTINISTHILPFVNKIAKFITGKNAVSIIGEAFKKMFGSSISTEGLATSLGGIVKNIGGIGTVIGGAYMAIKNFLDMLKDGFNWIDEALMVLGTAIAAIGAALLGVPAGIAAAVAAAVSAIGTIIVVIHDNWDSIVEFFTTTITQWWNGTVIPFFEAIPEKIGEIWETVKRYTVEKWNAISEFIKGIPEKIGEVVTSISNWFSELPGKIGYALGYAIGTIASWASDLYGILSEKIPQIIDVVIEFFNELPGKIWNVIVKAKDKIVEWANGIWDFLSEKVPEIISGVTEFFKGLPGKIWDAIVGTVQKLQEWAGELYNKVIEEIPKIVNKIIEFFKGLPEKIYEIGKNIVFGFVNGIKDFAKSAWDGITDFAGGVVKGFKDAMGIHSPSKVFYGLGENIINGLKNGIDAKANVAKNTINNLGKNLETSMGGSIERIGKNLNSKFSQIEDRGKQSARNVENSISSIKPKIPHITVNWSSIGFGSTRFSIPSFNLNWYAKGGLFDGASVIGVGEAGREAVLPLENRKAMSMISESILSNASGIGMDEDALVDAVARGVAMALMNNQQNPVNVTCYAELKTEDNEVLARAVTKGQQKLDYRMNPTPQFG